MGIGFGFYYTLQKNTFFKRGIKSRKKFKREEKEVERDYLRTERGLLWWNIGENQERLRSVTTKLETGWSSRFFLLVIWETRDDGEGLGQPGRIGIQDVGS